MGTCGQWFSSGYRYLQDVSTLIYGTLQPFESKGCKIVYRCPKSRRYGNLLSRTRSVIGSHLPNRLERCS